MGELHTGPIHPLSGAAQKIPKIMAVNYSGHQLTRRLGCAAPAYHKNEGVTPQPGACKCGLGLGI